MARIEEIRQRTWDFGLTILTVALLASLGVQSFVGTLWVWLSQRGSAEWMQGPGYPAYVETMNLIAAPQVIALAVVMGLCVPKRLFARSTLLAVSAGMMAVGAIAGLLTGSVGRGLAIYLGLAAVIQVAVVLMTIAGVRGPSYLTEGRLTKTGSGLLHLGFLIFGIVVVALQRSSLMLPVFWTSALLVTLGTALSFYASRIAFRRATPQAEISFAEQDEPSDHSGQDEPGEQDMIAELPE